MKPLTHLAWTLLNLKQGVAHRVSGLYVEHVAANSATDLGGSNSKRRNSAPHSDCRRFFCARILVLWRVAQEHPRVRRVPFAPIRQSCATRHPFLLGGRSRWFLSKRIYNDD